MCNCNCNNCNDNPPCKFCDNPKPFGPGESGEPVCRACRAMCAAWESDPHNQMDWGF